LGARNRPHFNTLPAPNRRACAPSGGNPDHGRPFLQGPLAAHGEQCRCLLPGIATYPPNGSIQIEDD
jgi:hypothetical protein